MNATRWIPFVSSCVLLLAAAVARASGTLGVYGIVERVVFEPSASAPERVRVYGAFALYASARAARAGTPDGGPAISSAAAAATSASAMSGSERGYLYFTLPFPETSHAAARREWADLAAVAGTGEPVAFAGYGFIGAFSAARSRAAADVLVAIPVSEYPPEVREMRERMNGNLVFAGSSTLKVWSESATDAAPVRYSTAEVGVVRLGTGNHDDVVAELRKLLER